MKKGIDVIIDPLAQIKNPDLVTMGDHNAIDFAYISTKLTMGSWIHIAPFVSIIGGKKSLLTMGNFAFISSGTRIICGSDDFTKGLVGPVIPEKYRNVIYSEVVMEDFSGTGTNCTVMPGVRMAIGSILGANSLLTKDTEPWGIYVGSPAKLIKYRNKKLILGNAKKLGYELQPVATRQDASKFKKTGNYPTGK